MAILLTCTPWHWYLACSVFQCLCIFRQYLYCRPPLPLSLPDLTSVCVAVHVISVTKIETGNGTTLLLWPTLQGSNASPSEQLSWARGLQYAVICGVLRTVAQRHCDPLFARGSHHLLHLFSFPGREIYVTCPPCGTAMMRAPLCHSLHRLKWSLLCGGNWEYECVNSICKNRDQFHLLAASHIPCWTRISFILCYSPRSHITDMTAEYLEFQSSETQLQVFKAEDHYKSLCLTFLKEINVCGRGGRQWPPSPSSKSCLGVGNHSPLSS